MQHEGNSDCPMDSCGWIRTSSHRQSENRIDSGGRVKELLILIIVLTLLVVAGSLISAEGHAHALTVRGLSHSS